MATPRMVAATLVVSGITATVAGAYWRAEWSSATRQIVAAVGYRRLVEPRLMGGFAYGSCRAANTRETVSGRCADPAWPTAAVASRLRRIWGDLARGRRTAENLHARGILDLLVDNAPEAPHRASGNLRGSRGGAGDLAADPGSTALRSAVRELERASLLAPRDAAIENDLSAAYLLLGERESDPWLLVEALSAVESALALAPDSQEALFNRALVCERLGLRGPARSAWLAFLERDGESGWAGEASAHLERSRVPMPRLLWQRQLEELAAAAARQDRSAVADIVGRFPQEAREYASEDLLSRWGNLTLAHRDSAANMLLTEARYIGAALAVVSGEWTIADAVRAIEGTASAEARAALAQAHVDYAAGEESFGRWDLRAAARNLAAAAGPLERAGSPLALSADATRSAIAFYDSRRVEATALLESIPQRATRYPALQGRVEWYLGLSAAKEGRLGAALLHYRRAAERFAAIREGENLGAVQGLLAEVLGLLGDRDEAWAWRLRALAVLSGYPRSLRLHNLLRDSADAALAGGRAQAALAFQDEDVAVATRSRVPGRLAEAFQWRSRIQLALGRTAEAFADLEKARRESACGAFDSLRDKLDADNLLFEGELEGRLGLSARSIVKLDSAIERYRQLKAPLDLAVALLGRAEAELQLGRDAEAEGDQETAIGLFERQRTAVEDRRLLVSSAEAGQERFDRMIRLEVERRQRPEKALEFDERSRSLAVAPSSAADLAAPMGERLSTIPEDVAVVEYALLPDRLYVWVLTRRGVRFAVRSVSSRQLQSQIAALLDTLELRSPYLGPASVAADIYEEILPPAVRSLPRRFTLVLVPDKVLYALPFAALVDRGTGRYLIEDHALALVPSLRYAAERWAHPRARPVSWRATLVGNPAFDRNDFPAFEDLPGADREVAAIAGLYPGARLLRGQGAGPSTILASLEKSELFHFAGHAISNPHRPDLSYLLASPEPSSPAGVVFARDVVGRRFPDLRLVVLSACGTLGPASSRVAGIAGLAQPLLDGGASAVVGTLWSVDDRPASRLMPRFHAAFLKERNATRALQEAQISLLHDTDSTLHPPAAWAAFQVFGLLEPRTD